MLVDSSALQIFRVRVLLEMTGGAHLHAYHGPTLYALLASAYGRAAGVESALPDGLLLDAPEQCRIGLVRGDRYAFGLTFIADSPAAAGLTLQALLRGLHRIGAERQPGARPFGGNFKTASVEDLITGRPFSNECVPTAIASNHIDQEISRLAGRTELTLRFLAPLRSTRPKSEQQDGHAFFDRDFFPPAVLLSRLQGRLLAARFPIAALEPGEIDSAAAMAENRLVWLDVSYGPAGQRKSLGGALGRIRFRIADERIIPMLVWGQYTRLGESTRFGFGAYRLEELGPDPFPCPRAAPLVELAFADDSPPDPDDDGKRVDGDEFSAAITALRRGVFAPHPHSKIQIPKDRDGFRELSIPSVRDRALQRRLLGVIGPALDTFFESSSFAYRRGFGRRRAAHALRSAFRRGYRFAVRADFRRYFDSIDHAALQDRLEAYLNDDAAAALIMTWVRAGAPAANRGIPTGAPLSPLLANLFLDEFDERVARELGWLVRYADDFLILFRDEAQAKPLLDAAREAADGLLLSLNADKTAAVDMREPFDFLGYRFHCTDRWQADDRSRLVRVEDLGWYDAAPADAAPVALPGEQAVADESAAPLVIFGPALGTLRLNGDHLICDYRDGQPATTVPINQVREVLLLGSITLTHRAARACLRHNIAIHMASDNGDVLGVLSDAEPLDDVPTITAQLSAAQMPDMRLQIAKTLLTAKLRNFAALAEAFPGAPADPELALRIRRLSEQMTHATAVAQLLGFEGAAAAEWYAKLSRRLPERFPFRKRVAPNASDPINVLLNIAYTALYRQASLAARLVGLSPALGILHEPRAGHMALASDLMEPFRHLMERVVIEAAAEFKTGQFTPVTDGPFRLRIAPDATRRFNARIYETFEQPVIARGSISARSYRLHLIAQARSLRRHLLDPRQAFAAFEHYPAGPPS